MRLIEYFDRRLFLSDNFVQREEQMLKGIQSRRTSLELTLTLGDSEKSKGKEFLNMLKDFYHDDEVVNLLISKVAEED